MTDRSKGKRSNSKKTSSNGTEEVLEPPGRTRLRKLTIRNFRCIGSRAVEVELDQVVVLVGPNNVGKSSILRAYELVMQHGSRNANLTLEDFPLGKVDPGHCPEIELETIVGEGRPGPRWTYDDPDTGEVIVREKWSWLEPGPATRSGWDVEKREWVKECPWGAPNVAKARRPQAHRVEAFQSPDNQTREIVKILKQVLDARVKNAKRESVDGSANRYQTLKDQLKELQKEIVSQAKDEIQQAELKLTEIIGEVFPQHVVRFDARPEEDVDRCLVLFGHDLTLRMGLKQGHHSPIEYQGSGAQRTLLWAALRLIAEQSNVNTEAESSHVLLLDEPELCLHPDAIREARRVLYELPRTGNWQVMITTHSPVFIDLAYDNTSILRVERDEHGDIQGTTIFRPKRAKLDIQDRAQLKMLNACDPHIAEFFFGGRTIIVEGDTEYTAFRCIIDEDPKSFPHVHIVRARGKATITTLCKILNHFGARYAVLHDSDRPNVETRKTKQTRSNPAWSVNEVIRNICADARRSGHVRLVASIPNFEEAFFGEEAEDEKPFAAFQKLKPEGPARTAIKKLLLALLDSNQILPSGAIEWSSMEQLQEAVGCKMLGSQYAPTVQIEMQFK